MRQSGRGAAWVMACAALGWGCNGADGADGAEPDGSSASSRAGSEVEGQATGTTVRSAGSGCRANGGRVPDGAVRAEVVDVDGDGRRDEVWFSPQPTQRFGVATASGAVVGTTVVTAKPVDGVVVVDADEQAPVEALVRDGASAHLHVFDRCQLVPVIGPDGRPYVFDLGYLGRGTGAVCADADEDGVRDLVGVNAVDNRDGTATVSRTVVELDGAVARHGHTDESTIPTGTEPDPLADTMGIRCGDMSITAEMLGGGPPG